MRKANLHLMIQKITNLKNRSPFVVKADICILSIISCFFILTGTMLLMSEHWPSFKPIKKILAKDVVLIEQGVKKLIYMPPGGTSATLDSCGPGFDEILAVILKYDRNNLDEVKEITHRLDFVEKFYWSQKGPVGIIFLNSKAGADNRDSVHPVNFASTVLGWIEQERIRRLTIEAFRWIFLGVCLALVGCFFTSNKGFMIYLILGTIISLIAIGLIIHGLKLFGMLLLLIGAALGIKGRNKLDKGKEE